MGTILFLGTPYYLITMAIKFLTVEKVKQPLKKVPYASHMFDDRMRTISENLYERIKQTPELVSLLDSVVSDHFMGPVDFFDANGRPLGPTKQKQVESFWNDSSVQSEAFYGQAMDYFVDGSSFGWHANASHFLSSEQKNVLSKFKEMSPMLSADLIESSYMPRKISYLAASTVEIKHNEFGILYFLQQAAGKTVEWSPEQVVHIKLIDFNGEIRGYSALKAMIKEIVIMYMLKENIIAKLENGGSPDNIISMVNANGVARARFERLRIALESFSHLKKSHGNMPIDADIKVHSLGTELKDMEYRELAMFCISEFALALGLPTSRVPFLMTGSGGSSNKGELSGNSEDSYQTKINARRSQWENSWNKVFKKAGFTFKFRRDNLQDSVRETQASVQRGAFVKEVQDSLFRVGKSLKLSSHLALLSGKKKDISEEDVEDAPENNDINNAGAALGGIGGQMQPSNTDMKSKVSQDKSSAKEKTAFNNERYK